MSEYSPLATPSATRAVLEEFGLATKKRLGQNFLVSDAIVGKILDLAELSDTDTVLEVGPGIGTLSLAILPLCEKLIAVEADSELVEVLGTTCSGHANKMTLIEGDAMRVDPHVLGTPNKFVSNLPYQVAATLILRYLSEIDSLERAVVMVQKEVADRISAQESTKAYGAYTAKLALFGKVTARFELGPSNFMPPPHVDSSVVRIERIQTPHPREERALTPDELRFCCAVIDAAFAQRRKTIRNSMQASGFGADVLDQAFEACGIEPTCRAETLKVEQFVALSCALSEPTE